jgi:Uma2 family endonuclease
MVARIDPLMTVDDLDCMPEDGNRYEVIEGELFVSRAPGLPHQVVSGNMFGPIWTYLEANPVGQVIASPGLVLSEYSGVIPDIVFFTHQRGTEIISGVRLIAAPDIVIEILSPGHENVARDRIAKRQLYAKHGVNEYWILDSENRAVEIYRLKSGSLNLAATLKDEDQITSPLLPAFGCAVSQVFRS